MPFVYSLADYGRYRDRVQGATYIDISRRTDPARIGSLWDNLRQIVATYGAPWVVQIWTKDVEGILQQGGTLLEDLRQRGTTLTAQVTITGLAGSVWEPAVPRNALDHLPQLAALLGGVEHIKWRYDPIIPSVHSPERFDHLARRISAIDIHQAIINFIAPPGRYKRVDRRLAPLLPGWSEGLPTYDLDWQADVARELVDIATSHDIRLACCAESSALHARVAGLGRAACGDWAWFCRLSPREQPAPATRGSRPGCGCAAYYDVGNYGQWSKCHRCAYCYAG